ncbi:MAG: hypothetical protein ACYSU7_14280 [Planctomycetota bacterium]|jgi:hypothetical protein
MDYKFILRRVLLAVGAVLLVGGWGLTHYADAQLEAVASGKAEPIAVWDGERVKASAWVGKNEFLPSRNLYQTGILLMGIGAAVVIVSFPRGSWQPHGGP